MERNNQLMMMGVGFTMFLVIVGVIVYITVFKKDDASGATEDPVTTDEAGTTEDPAKPKDPATTDPNGNVIKGQTTANLVVGKRRRYVKVPGNSMAECRKKAKQYGYLATGYRNADHPDSKMKNTCFFYTKAEPRWSGEKRDFVQVSGCTDASKKWPDCGTDGGVIPGWARSNLVTQPEIRAKNIDECREKAEDLEYVGVGYRTSENSVMEKKDTCFFYDGTDARFKGDFRDLENVTGCTDATKSWPDC